MSAMVLRTGSKTRKLTDQELIRLACWHIRQAAAVQSWLRELEDAQQFDSTAEVEPPTMAAREFDWEESEREFAELPEKTRELWLNVANANYFTLCVMLGDAGRVLAEPAEEGGPTP